MTSPRYDIQRLTTEGWRSMGIHYSNAVQARAVAEKMRARNPYDEFRVVEADQPREKDTSDS